MEFCFKNFLIFFLLHIYFFEFIFFSACNDVLPPDNAETSSNVYFAIMDAYIDSPFTWCANSADKAPFVVIEFLISGNNVQGDSNKEAWVNKFELSYGILKNKMTPNKVC